MAPMPLRKRIGDFVSNLIPMPMNTLNRVGPPPAALDQELPVEPSPKRQKTGTEDAFPTSAAQFAPVYETQSSPPLDRPAASIKSGQNIRKASSVLSSSKSGSQYGVAEYRHMDRMVNPRTNNRKRRKVTPINSPANPHVVDDTDDVGDVGAEEDVLQGSGHGAQHQQPASKHGYSRLFLQPKPSATTTRKTAPSNRPRDSSPDPLSQDAVHQSRTAKRAKTQASQSESLRGGITSTSFKRPNHTGSRGSRNNKRPIGKKQSDVPKHIVAQDIVTDQLRIKSAVSGDFAYPGSSDGVITPCILRVDDISTILLPTDHDGKLLGEYSYLSVDMTRVHAIYYAESPGCVISIHRSLQPEKSAAGKLLIEFEDHEVVEKFLEWARAMVLQTTIKEPVKCEFVHLEDETLVKKLVHSSTLAKKSKVLRDEDDHKTLVPADVELATQRQKARRQGMKSEANGIIKNFENRQTRQSPITPRAVTHDDSDNKDAITIPESPVASTTRATRNRPSMVVERSPTPKGWTEEHPDWSKSWRNSLVFPHMGKNRATVDQNDIERLDEGQFLNDNLIIFYLRYLQDKLEKTRPDIAKRVHFHNTFFYEKLKSSRGSGSINYDSVKGWTSKVDLFSKDFIIVPINEYAHWYVAIIYNAPKLLHYKDPSPEVTPQKTIDLELAESATGRDETASDGVELSDKTPPNDGAHVMETKLRRMSIHSSGGDFESQQDGATMTKVKHGIEREADDSTIKIVESDMNVEGVRSTNDANRSKATSRVKGGPRKHDLDQTKIITLDSLGSPHSPACSNLRHYLEAELKDKKNIEIPSLGPIGMTAKQIPQQSNYCDCGLYLLGYIEALLQNPEEVVHRLLQREKTKWSFSSSQMRVDIRELIFTLQKEQQQREDDDEVQRKQRKRMAAIQKSEVQQTPSEGDAASPTKSPSPAEAIPTISQVVNSQSNSTRRATVDASAMLTRQTATVDTPGGVPANGKSSGVTTSKHATIRTMPSVSRRQEEKMAMPGQFPSPLPGSPRCLERTESDSPAKDFVPRLSSSENQGDTDKNPLDVDGSPHLMRQLEQNLHDAERSEGQRTPRRVLQPDADTPRKSVEQPESDTHQASRITQRPRQTPVRAAAKRSDDSSLRTNLEIEASSSTSHKKLREATDTRGTTSSRPRKPTGSVSDFFPTRRNPPEETIVGSEYMGSVSSKPASYFVVDSD